MPLTQHEGRLCSLTAGRSMPRKGLFVLTGLLTASKKDGSISADGVDVVCRRVIRRIILANTETMQPIQPRVVRMTRGQPRRSSNSRNSRQLAADETVMTFRSKVNDARIRDQNQCAVPGFQGCTYIQQSNAIPAQRYPIPAHRTYLPLNGRTGDLTIRDVKVNTEALR